MSGGFNVGEMIYVTGPSMKMNNGDRVVHGGQGEVIGPADNGGARCPADVVGPAISPHSKEEGVVRVVRHWPYGRR